MNTAPPALPDSYSLRRVSLRAPGQLILLAEGLIHGAYGNIIRAKGTVEAGGVPLHLDVADGRYAIGGVQKADGKADGKMVFIGTEIDRARLDALLCPAKAPGALKLPRRFQRERGVRRNGA